MRLRYSGGSLQFFEESLSLRLRQFKLLYLWFRSQENRPFRQTTGPSSLSVWTWIWRASACLSIPSWSSRRKSTSSRCKSREYAIQSQTGKRNSRATNLRWCSSEAGASLTSRCIDSKLRCHARCFRWCTLHRFLELWKQAMPLHHVGVRPFEFHGGLHGRRSNQFLTSLSLSTCGTNRNPSDVSALQSWRSSWQTCTSRKLDKLALKRSFQCVRLV